MAPRKPGPDHRVSKAPHGWISLRVVFPGDVLDLWETAKSRLEREGLDFRADIPEAIWNGQIVEALLAEYIAGPEYPSHARSDDEHGSAKSQ